MRIENVADACQQVFDSGACLRRNGKFPTPRSAQVRFAVDNQNIRGLDFGQRLHAIVQHDNEIGRAHGLVGAIDADLLHHVIGLAQAGRIGDANQPSVEIESDIDEIAGCTGNIGDNRDVTLRQIIDQA